MSKVINRMWLISQLIKQRYKAQRPTAHQISEIIDKFGLKLYDSNGKHRSKEAMTKAVAKAYKVLR